MLGGFFEQIDSGILVIHGYAVLLFLEDEVHVSKPSSRFVTFDSSCHLAQLHCEVLDCQDGWFFADLGEFISIKCGFNGQCNLSACAGACHCGLFNYSL
jgi:hypothetical protein